MSFLEFIWFLPRFSLLFRWNFTAFSEKFIRSLPADTLNLFGFYLEIFSFSLGISITFPKISQLFSLEFLSFSPSFYPLLPYTFSVFFFLGIYLLFSLQIFCFFTRNLFAISPGISWLFFLESVCLHRLNFLYIFSGNYLPLPLEIFRLFLWRFSAFFSGNFSLFLWKFSVFPSRYSAYFS